ncbi:type II and III secretion system protein family protein [Desulfurivibrio alkaliphilus]|uniref:Type II and III secretion system protein n=1 Tax=Desulfurivibrio alkaliphilus (strain DSM 19089 / UNIQEM U267 / AHT2) TaxID=589865 RepID=D6Z1Q3_DESAT|nr:pilus assembly protein N-terminal domain-containing protein [Desulfurivibrio alkaliphilus]ADH85478.1 type II and III secretion system protein [Desulfurivibrio alkaliphilus AHT 2]
MSILKRSVTHPLLLLTMCLAVLLPPGAVAAAPDSWRPDSLRLEAQSQHVISRDQPIIRVAVADPSIMEVEMISQQELLLTALAPGATQLRLWHQETEPEMLRVVVVPAAPYQDYDIQVRADIRVVEVSRRALRQSGVNLLKDSDSITVATTAPGVLTGIDNQAAGLPLASDSGFVPLAQAFNLVAGDAKQRLLGIISLLESNGFAYTLAEPSLTVMSGKTASFLAGGEVPIPVSHGTSGSVSIEYRDFGVRLQLTPTVLDPRRITIEVSPEVSELDFSAAVSTAGVTVPGFRVRRTETTVQLADGESFVISGLISNENASTVEKVPFLGSLPILGAFFKSTRLQSNDKELIMVVTPHLVRPLERGAQVPLPGEHYRDYQPGFGTLLFLEDGSFNRRTHDLEGGFSE